MKYKDISGQKFGRLIALYKLHNYHKTGSYWLCYCECGNVTEVYLGSLSSGATTSCGCYHKEVTIQKFTKHGKRNTRLYKIWKGIKYRCANRNYKYYGGRGITICYEWKDNFINFYEWAVNNGYDDTLSIDRIDVNGNYEPSNCRWATPEQQSRNRRYCKYFTYNNETRCIREWCEILHLNYKTVSTRLSRNWTIEKALELEGYNVKCD